MAACSLAASRANLAAWAVSPVARKSVSRSRAARQRTSRPDIAALLLLWCGTRTGWRRLRSSSTGWRSCSALPAPIARTWKSRCVARRFPPTSPAAPGVPIPRDGRCSRSWPAARKISRRGASPSTSRWPRCPSDPRPRPIRSVLPSMSWLRLAGRSRPTSLPRPRTLPTPLGLRGAGSASWSTPR